MSRAAIGALDSRARVKGVAYDTPILGYRRRHLQYAAPLEGRGSRVVRFRRLQPRRLLPGGRRQDGRPRRSPKCSTRTTRRSRARVLRLEQQYFFVSCSLQDMLRIHLVDGAPARDFHAKWAVQLNDTHPSIAVAELMRLLVDDTDWAGTRPGMSPCHLRLHESYPAARGAGELAVGALRLAAAAASGDHLRDQPPLSRRGQSALSRATTPGFARMSLIDESGDTVRAHGASGHRRQPHVNGVARLHSELLKQTVLRDFAELWPDNFSNVTNGVTPRRFVALTIRPGATSSTRTIGDGWMKDSTGCASWSRWRTTPAFQQRVARRQARRTRRDWPRSSPSAPASTSIPDSLFDIQVKRIHEYKRQHLNVLHILTLYLRLKRIPRPTSRRARSFSAARPRPATSWPS